MDHVISRICQCRTRLSHINCYVGVVASTSFALTLSTDTMSERRRCHCCHRDEVVLEMKSKDVTAWPVCRKRRINLVMQKRVQTNVLATLARVAPSWSKQMIPSLSGLLLNEACVCFCFLVPDVCCQQLFYSSFAAHFVHKMHVLQYNLHFLRRHDIEYIWLFLCDIFELDMISMLYFDACQL